VPLILPLGKPFVFLGFLYSGIPLSDLSISVSNRADLQCFQISECVCGSIPSVRQFVAFWAGLTHCPFFPHRAVAGRAGTNCHPKGSTPPVAQGRQ
jgi:hypothetical protein